MPIDRRTFLLLTGAAACGTGAGAGAATVEAPMRRTIPGTREALPVIGLGTADTFDVGNRPEERAPLAEVLAMLLRTSGSVLDTAPSYGRAEVVSGDLLQAAEGRARVFLATKISARAGAPAEAQWKKSRADLRSPYADLLQIHNLIDWRNNLRWLRELKSQNAIRYLGVTHYRDDSHDELVQIVRSEGVDFVQINYSVGERNAERVLLPLCRDRGVAVLINRPFQDGRLFSAVRGKPLPPWAGEIDCDSWAQIFLKFVVGHPAVTAAIPATSKPKNMADNLGAALGRMPDEDERARIAQLFA